MIPTYFGVIVLVLGAWLLRRNDPIVMVCWMMGLGLLAASAAIMLPALGGSSIPPAKMFLGFALLSVGLHIRNRATLLNEAVVANAPLVIFSAYGFISAFILPRIFAFQMDVVPLRPVGLRHLLDAFPLMFSPQNVTTAFYMVGTALTAIVTYIAARLATDVTPVVKACVIIAMIHAVTGLLGVVLAGTPWDLFVDLVRNGSYGQLRQQTDSFIRVAGLMPEPANYASFGIVWWIFSLELWLRNIQPRQTGIAALALGCMLAISTSSTAYVAMAGSMAILAVRVLLSPPYLKANKLITAAMVVMLGGALVAVTLLVVDGLAKQITDLLDAMLWNKAQSDSGQQRAFWAMQGIDAFMVSKGLGIGAGSFRSSSIATAIIGSMGVIGAVTFTWSCASLFVPRTSARELPADDTRRGIAEAAAWAAVAGLLPPMINQASPDPGMEYAAFAGLALALRRPALARVPAKMMAGNGWRRLQVAAPPTEAAAARQPTPPEAPQRGGWRHSAR